MALKVIVNPCGILSAGQNGPKVYMTMVKREHYEPRHEAQKSPTWQHLHIRFWRAAIDGSLLGRPHHLGVANMYRGATAGIQSSSLSATMPWL